LAENVIIYGNVLSDNEKRKICLSSDENKARLIWQDDASLANLSSFGTVFVDLDDPQFASSKFLSSVITSSQDVKLIGKSKHKHDQDDSHLTMLGISEILDPEQCLDRLTQLLAELETAKPAKVADISQIIGREIIGSSTQISEIRRYVELLADVDFPSALVLGETGTGKGLISRTLHSTGIRSSQNFVEINCSAIPQELFESELFGHVKGAFTDAHKDKRGLFEYADRGTLFLDEIGDLPMPAQAKLLKILEDRKLRKVGAVEDQEINVRIIAATNTNLDKLVADDRFREDLFFRLNLMIIEIPPLRERQEDIPELIDHYLNLYSTLYNKGKVSFHNRAIARMQQYSWPGNTRELCNVVERAVLLNKTGVVSVEDIGASLKQGRISSAERGHIALDLPAHGRSLNNIQCTVIKHVLNMFKWNKSEAAKYLDISRPRLRRIIESNGLERDKRRN